MSLTVDYDIGGWWLEFHHCNFAIISSFVSVPAKGFGSATACPVPAFGKHAHLSSFLVGVPNVGG